MASSYQLTDLIQTIELEYNAESQQYYQALYGKSIETPEPLASWHEAEGRARELVDTVDDVRTAYLEMRVVRQSGEGIDDVLNRISQLRRLLKQAERHSAGFDARPVYLRIRLDGATYATMVPVLYGFVDDGAALYRPESEINSEAHGVVLGLYLHPYGEAEEPISLSNILTNPAFEVEGPNSGLAAGWQAVGTSNYHSLVSDATLFGGWTQKVEAPSSNYGVGQTVEVQALSAAAYVWLRADPKPGSSVIVRFYNKTISMQVAAVIFDPNNPSAAFQSVTGEDGETWYRVALEADSSIAGGDQLALEIYAQNEITFYVGAAYMEWGITAAELPEAWASKTSQLFNRADPNDSEPHLINYIDLWGIKGDVPALARIKFTGVGGRYFWIGMSSSGRDKLIDRPYFLDSADGLDLGGDWVNENAQQASGGNFEQLLSTDNEEQSFGWSITAERARAFARRPLRALARMNSSDEDTGVARMEFGEQLTDWVTLPEDDEGYFGLVDLGLINMVGDIPDEAPVEPHISFALYTNVESGGTVDLDGVFLLPADDLCVVDFLFDIGSSSEFWIDGIQDTAIRGAASYHVSGSIPQPLPGALNRIFFISANSKKSGSSATFRWDNSTSWRVELEILPRSRHLLGAD